MRLGNQQSSDPFTRGPEGGARRSCKGGIVAVAGSTEHFSPSKCISIAELLGGQQHQKKEARGICNNSQYLKSRKGRSVFKDGWRERKGGEGARVLKAASANVLQQNNFSFPLFFSSPLVFYFFPSLLSAISATQGRQRKKKSLKTIIIKTPAL